MRCIYLLVIITAVALISCRKEKKTTMSPPGPPRPPAPTVFLKDVIASGLPSPLYHFEYGLGGNVNLISYASGLYSYNVAYSGGRISELRNNILVNKDRLQYFYDNPGRVSEVRYADSAGIVYTRIYFTYAGEKLIKVEREKKSGTVFIAEKTMTMSYYPDGNLLERSIHYAPINGQPGADIVDKFELYDSKINVGGFALTHNDFFDHFVFLPGVQLQKNNPGKETHTGSGPHYTVEYTYSYNNSDLPLSRNGEGMFTNGANAGQRFQTNRLYSYY